MQDKPNISEEVSSRKKKGLKNDRPLKVEPTAALNEMDFFDNQERASQQNSAHKSSQIS